MMSRLSVATVVVLSLSGIAWGQVSGTVVSYFADPPPSPPPDVFLLGEVPGASTGFVLTDVSLFNVSGGARLYEGDPALGGVLRASLPANACEGTVHHFNSGIPFHAGSEVYVELVEEAVGDVEVTGSGYLPCPDSCGLANVPAIGTIGLVVLVSGLMTAGGYVVRRRMTA